MEASKNTVNRSILKKHFATGFTMIELMVAIAILGILATVAMPNLSEFTIKMRVDNEVREIQRLLLATRNAAINTGANASLCPLRNDDTCDPGNTDWKSRIGIVTSEGLVKEREALTNNDALDFVFDAVTYGATGQLANNNIGIFRYCPKGHSTLSRGVELNLSGRGVLTADTNGDGKDQTRQGLNIICP